MASVGVPTRVRVRVIRFPPQICFLTENISQGAGLPVGLPTGESVGS